MNLKLHQQEYRILPDIFGLFSGAPEKSPASCTSLAEQAAQVGKLKIMDQTKSNGTFVFVWIVWLC